MKKILPLFACLPLLAACKGPVTTAQMTENLHGNDVQVTSGTLSTGRFVSVANTQKTWGGALKGGREQWGRRRNALRAAAQREIERICGDWFFATLKGPNYNMLDSDETMGGVAPALGVTVAIAAYLAAEASTQDINVPTSVYMEFSCKSDEK